MPFKKPILCLTMLALTLFVTGHAAQAKTHHRHVARHHAAGAATTTHHAALIGNSPKFASLIIDAQTGAVYHQDDPDKSVHPASLTKMMTLALVFNGLSQHRFSLQSRVPISAFAHSMAPSKLDIPVGSTISVENAIYAVVTHSSNDIAVALGEFVGGSQAGFARMMNAQANSWGMTHTNYVNACGLHNPAQVTTARDQATLARVLIYRFPQYYHYFSTPSFTYAGRVYANHNHLMETYPGMDGLKTGYIVPSGFNLVASTKRGNRRLIGVIFGGTSAHGRDVQMAQLLDAAFATPAQAAGAPPPSRPTLPALPTSAGLIAALPPGQHILAQPAVQVVATRAAMAAAPVDAEGDDDTNDSAPVPGRIAAQIARSPAPAGISPAAGSQAVAVRPQVAAPMQLASAVPAATVAKIAQPDWSVQIGAYGDRQKTDLALKAVIASLPAELRQATPEIAPLTSSAGTVYRGRLNGLTQAQAGQVCQRVPNCLTISPDAGN